MAKTSATINKLASFESSRFIIATDATSSGGVIKLSLPRYQIMLTQAHEKAPLEYVWQGRRLILSETAVTLGEGVSPLTFADTKGQVLLFPVQPFVAKGESRQDEYYLLEPDMDAILQEKRTSSRAIKEDGLWHYQGTESFLMIKVRAGEALS